MGFSFPKFPWGNLVYNFFQGKNCFFYSQLPPYDLTKKFSHHEEGFWGYFIKKNFYLLNRRRGKLLPKKKIFKFLKGNVNNYSPSFYLQDLIKTLNDYKAEKCRKCFEVWFSFRETTTIVSVELGEVIKDSTEDVIVPILEERRFGKLIHRFKNSDSYESLTSSYNSIPPLGEIMGEEIKVALLKRASDWALSIPNYHIYGKVKRKSYLFSPSWIK